MNKHKIPLTGADLTVYTEVMTAAKADAYLKHFITQTPWEQKAIKGGYNMPRLVASYAIDGAQYDYSGVEQNPLPTTPVIDSFIKAFSKAFNVQFNTVLLNYYRNGRDSIGWHADDKTGLDGETVASLSLGATRAFQFAPTYNCPPKLTIPLKHGEILFMDGDTQRNWLHRIPKEPHITQPRVSLTLRRV